MVTACSHYYKCRCGNIDDPQTEYVCNNEGGDGEVATFLDGHKYCNYKTANDNGFNKCLWRIACNNGVDSDCWDKVHVG